MRNPALWQGALSLAAGMTSQALAERVRIPSIVVLLLAGTALGPDGAGILDPAALGAGRGELVRPWPDIVLGIGRRSVPAARWIRDRAGGRTRLVWLGRPRVALRHFDLVLASPQYAMPDAPNLVRLSLPWQAPMSEPPAAWPGAQPVVQQYDIRVRSCPHPLASRVSRHAQIDAKGAVPKKQALHGKREIGRVLDDQHVQAIERRQRRPRFKHQINHVDHPLNQTINYYLV